MAVQHAARQIKRGSPLSPAEIGPSRAEPFASATVSVFIGNASVPFGEVDQEGVRARASSCRRPASTARPRSTRIATAARAAVLLFRLRRGLQRSGDRHAHRGNGASDESTSCMTSGARSIRRLISARSKAASSRARAGSPRRNSSGTTRAGCSTHAPITYKIPVAADVPARFQGRAVSTAQIAKPRLPLQGGWRAAADAGAFPYLPQSRTRSMRRVPASRWRLMRRRPPKRC